MTAARIDDRVIKMKPKKPAPEGGWQERLILTDKGTPKACLANAITALRYAPEWDGVLWHDAFAVRTVARRAPPWLPPSVGFEDMEWTDKDDIRAADWLQHQDIAVSPMVAGQAVEVVSSNHTFHPVREYLDGLEWDGVERLSYWLRDYLGVADTQYSRAVGGRWLISAVARIYWPGCKADCALILEGPQGLKKSTALAVLGGPWFTDQIADLGNKDSCVDVQGAWIMELAELDSMSRGEVGRIKAFMSRATDRFRMPFGKRTTPFPRQCIFAGTVNPEGTGYLKDVTGGRRFWPVTCTKIDIEGLERDVHQLWAEAVDKYAGKCPWWLNTPELEQAAEIQQRARYIGDAWEGPIAEYLSDKSDTTLAQILEYGLVLDKGRWDQVSQNRAVRVLVSLGWEQYRKRENGTVVKRYRKRKTEDRSQQKPQNSAIFDDVDVNGVNGMRSPDRSHENSSVSAGFDAVVNGVNGVNGISGTCTHTGARTHTYECSETEKDRSHRSQSDKLLYNNGFSCERSGVNGPQKRSHRSHSIPAGDQKPE